MFSLLNDDQSGDVFVECEYIALFVSCVIMYNLLTEWVGYKSSCYYFCFYVWINELAQDINFMPIWSMVIVQISPQTNNGIMYLVIAVVFKTMIWNGVETD